MYFGIHHIQLACPAGSEDVQRRYFVDILGMTEVAKPQPLRGRGGCWFRGPGDAALEIHLGVESEFRPTRKGHPGIAWGDMNSLRALAERLESAGYPVTWSDELWGQAVRLNGMPGAPTHAAGFDRFHTTDAFDNRLEFLAPVEG